MLNENLNQDKEFKISNQSSISSKFVIECNTKETIRIINTHDHKLKDFQNNPEKLMIVTDFDYTLTKNFVANERLFSCINALTYSNYISQETQDTSRQLHLKYGKYEYDTTIDFSFKDQMMQSWFKESLELITTEKLSKEDFMNIILQAEKMFYYRFGILELFELIEKNNIPIFIVSGGVYEIIESSLKIILSNEKVEKLKEKRLLNIIANRFNYDENDFINGLQEPIVYTFNKGEILKKVFYDLNSGDGNIILMGDHIMDIESIKHIDYRDVIKIGYMNFSEDTVDETKKELVESYKMKYDVLVFDDGNLSYVNNLIKLVHEVGDKDITNIL